jgi:RHS repeat-associated protein
VFISHAVRTLSSGRAWEARPSRLRLVVILAVAVLTAVPVYLLAMPPVQAAAPGGAELAPGGVYENAGAFTASVAVAVPAFHGVEPKLSLAYSSLGLNGPFGVGWQLAGASTIDRFSPGRGAPAYTATDVFLLDGEEMVASTALGGNYVTKRQSYQRITFDSVANTWTVWGRDGRKNTYAARFDIAAGKTLRWMLSSVTDLHGNTVNYGYWCDGVLDCYLDTVSYNGTVVTLYRETRPDPILYGVGNQLARTNYRTKSIDVVVSGARARVYTLAYSVSPTTGRSLLASVTRHGRDATVDATGTVTAGSSLPAVAFTYKVDNKGVTRSAAFSGYCGVDVSVADVNGDGESDLLCHSGSNAAVALSNGAGGFVKATGAVGFCASTAQLGTGDFNADGRVDLFCHNGSTTTVALSDGLGGFTSVSPAFTNWCAGMVGTGDFNGDGATDLFCHDQPTMQTWIAMSDGAGGFTRIVGAFTWCSAWFGKGDFNGDGKTDFVCRDLSTSQTWVALSNGVGGFVAKAAFGAWCAESVTVYAEQIGSGDFNGDGKTDLWCHDPMNGQTWIALSTGNGNFSVRSVYSVWCDSGNPMTLADVSVVGAGDFNGDGKTDLFCHNPEASAFSIVLSNGTGGFMTGTSFSPWCPAGYQVGGGDFNGDGKADLLCHWAANGQTWTGTPGVLGAGDVMATVKNELGGVTTVSYSPAASWPDGTPTTGLLPPPNRLSTVSQVQVGDGLGHTVTTSYAYSAGFWDPVERRFLGYSQVTATDGSGAKTVTYFKIEPNYPVNRASAVVRMSAASVELETSVTGYRESVTAGVYTSLLDWSDHSWCDRLVMCQTTYSTVVSYDAYGNPTETDDLGDDMVAGDEKTTLTSYAYDTVAYAVSRPSVVTVRAGQVPTGAQLQSTQYGYNPAGDLISVSRWLNTTNTTVNTSATYDGFGNKLSATDEVGASTSWTYDATYHTFQTGQCQGTTGCGAPTCPAPFLCSYQGWDTVIGQLSSSTDVNGSVTSWNHDAFGRVMLESRPDGATTTTSYVNWGTPGAEYVQEAVSDGTPDGLWSQTYSDGQGRTVKKVAEPDVTVLTTYNTQGLVASVSNPFKGAAVPAYTTYGYDALGRQTSLTHPDGTSVITSYTVGQNALDPDFASPRLTKMTCDERGMCIRVAYDGAGHDVNTSEWDGVVGVAGVPEYRLHAVYDVLGRNTTVTDSLGNVTRLGWDSLGRKTSMLDPDAGSWTYGYDAAGHMTSQTDGNNKTVTSAYADPLGRLTSTSAGTGVLASYHYDEAGHGTGKGRLTSMTDTSGSTSWTYDALGRVTGLGKTIGTTTYSVAQVFDAAGRRKSLTYPDGQVVSTTYDASGCQSTVGGYVTAASCSPTQNTQTLGNGVVLTQNYDPNRMWLTTDTATLGATVLQNESYSYRIDGRVQSKVSNDAADQWTYGYDNLGRLTSANSTTTPAYTSFYTYDQIGRIITGAGLGSRSYPAPGTGPAHAPTSAGGFAYTYDGAGNLTADGSTTYTYDQSNRLASTTTGTVPTAYAYDGQGTRVKAGGLSFVELDGQVLFQTDGTASSDFLYYGTARVARRDSTGAVSYYVADRLGSPHLILDPTGAVRRTAQYSPYGTLLGATGTVTDPFGQAGDYRDPSGLYKRGVRYQDPATTLFTSPDPSGSIDPTKPQSLNRYAYASDDPLTNVDHTGKETKTVTSGSTQNTANGNTAYDISVVGLVTGHVGSAEKPTETCYTVGAKLGPNIEGQYAFTVGDEGWTGFGAYLGYEVEAAGVTVGATAKVDYSYDEWGDLRSQTSLVDTIGYGGRNYEIPYGSIVSVFLATQQMVFNKFLGLPTAESTTTNNSPDAGSPFENPISGQPPQVDENGFGFGNAADTYDHSVIHDWSAAFIYPGEDEHMYGDKHDPDLAGASAATLGGGEIGIPYADAGGFDPMGSMDLIFGDGFSADIPDIPMAE